jgi:hypothetical protein
MCQFIGEAFEKDMMYVDEENSSFQVGEKGIFSSFVGRWRQQLTHEEIFIAQEIAGRELQRLGYERAVVDVQIGKLCFLCGTAPYARARALASNREMTGPPFLIY